MLTHAAVRRIADNVCVMQGGRIVEAATTDEVFENSSNPNTQELREAIPGADI
jgi:peptide/nickel transport system ATP-binding protein